MKIGHIIPIAVILIVVIIASVSMMTPKLSPADFTYKTDQYPPHYFQVQALDGSVTKEGIAFDLIKAIAKDMGSEVTDNQLKVITWSEAVQDALLFNKTMLVGAFRTPKREALYKWVGPVVTDKTIVFAKKGSGIKITSPDDLNRYKIGAVTDYTAVTQLKDLGVKEGQIVLDSDFSKILTRLMNGDVDLICFGEYPSYYFAKQLKGSSSIIEPVYTVDASDLWFAFNRETPDSFIQSFQASLDKLKTQADSSGVTGYQSILNKYIGEQ
ncbi:MAG TPA: transporter substrate-binding domain-containing protein [Methanospirillum sp.]|nr:transporter substrate-binding domain-containing protein [Methanospirillum sp.]